MLKIKMIAIVFFGAAISLFSKDLSTSNNQPTQAKVVIEYEDGKTILSAPDLEPKEQCTYQWQQSADGKTWKNIRGAKKPQAQAVKDLPVNTFVRLQIKDGKSILYSTGAQTKPIEITNPLGYVYVDCPVKLGTEFSGSVDQNKFIKDNNSEVIYQWYYKETEADNWSTVDVSSEDQDNEDKNGGGRYLITSKPGWYKFLSFSNGYSENYETEKEEGEDYIASTEYELVEIGQLPSLTWDNDKTFIGIKKGNGEIEEVAIDKDAEENEIWVCAGDELVMRVEITNFAEDYNYKWYTQRTGFNSWNARYSKAEYSYVMKREEGDVTFKCEVTPADALEDCVDPIKKIFKVRIYNMDNPPTLEVIEEPSRGVTKITEEGVDKYYVCADPCQGTDCGNNEVKLIVNQQNAHLGGCVFKGERRPLSDETESTLKEQSKNTYIYEMAVYRWDDNTTDWEPEPNEKYTKLLNNYDPEQIRPYDFETGGFHLNKRTFKYIFDKDDDKKIQEESIKVCIHVIDSCAWIANKNGANEPLYKIGVATEPVIIAKYPTLKDQLEEIKEDITFKYQKEGEEAKNLPIGDECEKIDGEKVFVEWGDEAKEALKTALQKITTNEKIKFEWDLSELTEKIVDGASIPVEFEKTDYDADNDEVFNNALLTKEISFTFKGQDDVDCDLQDRLYGRNATPIKLKITTELCKEEVEKVDTVRKVNQVQLRGLIDCNAVEGEKKVCPNNEKYQLSFDAKYGAIAKEDDQSATYRIWVEHKAYTNVDDVDPAEEEFLKVTYNSVEHICNGQDVWWDGDQTKCVFELNLEKGDDGNLKYTKHTFYALVVTNRCPTVIGDGTGEGDNYKATIDEQIRELTDCGFSWDTTKFVIKVSESPTAPKIAILADDYKADIDDVNVTSPKVVIKKGTAIVNDFDDFVNDIERYEKNEDGSTKVEGREDVTLEDNDGNPIAWTIYALKKGQAMPKVSLLTLEGGDSLGCNCNEHTIDLTDDKQVKQSTYTYSWEKTTDVSDMSSFTEVEQRHYASWETYQKAGVLTSERFTGIFEVPALADDEEEVFYRLKMTDCCGKVTYSNIIQITAAESEPVKPVIGWDITEDATEKDKRGANYPYKDKENKTTTYYYNIETKTCADETVDPIAVVNTKEFEENESPIDKFLYQWQRRNGARTTDGKLPTNWSNWSDIPSATSPNYTPTASEFVAGEACQYRLVAWAPSHLEEKEGTDPTEYVMDETDTKIYKGSKVSEPVTVIVYKDVTKTSPDPDGPIEIFGTKNAKITDPLKLDGTVTDNYAMVLDNPDKLPYTSYSWKVSTDNATWEDLTLDNATTYFVTSTSYTGSTLQLSKFPSDADPRYYKGTVTYECGTHEQVFKVQANSSEKTTPVIGYEICEPSNTQTCVAEGKKKREFTKADGTTTIIMYYKDNDISICATEAANIPEITLVNTSEFEDHKLTTVDRFNYKWQKRSGDRKGQDLPADADWSAWVDIAGKTDPAVTPIELTDNFDPGYAYQYRLVAWAESHLKYEDETRTTPKTYTNDPDINIGCEISKPITVIVWNEIEKNVDAMKQDDAWRMSDDETQSTLEGTIHEQFEQGKEKELTLHVTNLDREKHEETYTWYVGKYDATANGGIDWKLTIDANTTETDLKQYNIAGKPDGATLKLTQMPADCTAIFYKVEAATECTPTVTHIFEVKSVYSRFLRPQIGIGTITKDGTCNSNNRQYSYKDLDKNTVSLCYKTELASNLCDGDILGDIIQLENNEEFDQNTIISDKYHFIWQTRSKERKENGDDPDWEDGGWTNITGYDYNVTQEDPNDNTKGINTTQLDYTTNNSNAPQYEAGMAYQYRLVVYRDHMAKSGILLPDTDEELMGVSAKSNIITIRVNKNLEDQTEDGDKSHIGCFGDPNGHEFKIQVLDVDGVGYTCKWEAKIDEEYSEVTEDNKDNYLIASVPKADDKKITISKMPDDPTKTYHYKVTVTPENNCGDPIEQEFTLNVTEPLSLVAGDIRFKEGDDSYSIDVTICEGDPVTVVTRELKIKNGKTPLMLAYYFFEGENAPSFADNAAREQAEQDGTLRPIGVLEDPIERSTDEEMLIDAEQTLDELTSSGWILLKITDGCTTSVWSNHIQVFVNEQPKKDIVCSYNYETDVICLNDPLTLSYTPDDPPTNITYTWSVINRNGVSYEFLKDDGTEATEPELSSLSTIKVKWTENNVTDQELVDATIKLTAKNTQTNCSSEDEFLVKICHEELLPQVTIGQKMNTEILLITEGIQGEQLYKWGYTSKKDSKKTDTTDWVPYSYWRYDYPYTDYGWKEPHTIDKTQYNYWVIVKGASDEKSYCQQTSKLTGTTDVNPKEKKHRYYTVKTKTDVTSAQNIPVYIDNPELKSVHLRLISSFGVVVVQKQLPPQATIETSLPATFSSGLYLLHVQVGDEQTTVKIRIQ